MYGGQWGTLQLQAVYIYLQLVAQESVYQVLQVMCAASDRITITIVQKCHSFVVVVTRAAHS